MKPVLLAFGGALLSVLAFPPFGPGFLILPGVTMFLWALRLAGSRRQGLLIGAVYGLVFFGGLMWWLAELELIALILVPVQAAFLAVYGWWLVRYNDQTPGNWLMLAVGGWAVMELIRYYFPVGGLEWGAAGYALSDNRLLRLPAAAVGTSGLTVLIVMIAAVAALAITRDWDRKLLWSVPIVLVAMAATVPSVIFHIDHGPRTVAIVQGSTPCPFEHCPPDERLRTYQQHLALTETIEPRTVDLVVWSEGSTGSTNADPVNNPEVGEAIGEQARRIGAPMLVGGDRVVSDTQWINANVYFDAEGEIVGEYRKQHPVPFGEYVPWRPVFDWIPALDRVPRDMIPGDGPVVFEGGLGSVISFEGGFSRYALESRRAGAVVIVVATNEASYGPDAPTSDQFIGMTRMRAVELGVPIVHAAVTGKSTITDNQGSFTSTSGLGTEEIFYGDLGPPTSPTPYTTIGNSVMYLAALLGLATWVRIRRLVGSGR
ncbi:MAG TPA: apolipoprotein N-acyltransferase [Acidimicrobiia bacterium]|nr:apolipoprotein N-acyltransferase [Acidimicrobiia bacterium]